MALLTRGGNRVPLGVSRELLLRQSGEVTVALTVEDLLLEGRDAEKVVVGDGRGTKVITELHR